MQDIVQLLFFMAAIAIGWWLGNRNSQNTRINELSDENYYRGLNYLLDHKTDEALELFIDSLAVNSQNLDTHLALGNAFRRKGEVDKAIHIHQNILNQPSLTHSQLAHAQLELAHDFVKAGLLDRAEKLLMESEGFSPDKQAWGTLLLDIYQREQDWQKALAVGKQFRFLNITVLAERLSHFACEQAWAFLQQNDKGAALEFIHQAISFNANNPRIQLLQAHIAIGNGEYAVAKHHLLTAVEQDQKLIPMVLADLSHCFSATNDEVAWHDWLDYVIAHHPSTSAILAKAEFIKLTSVQQAVDFVTQQLEQRPSVKGFDYLIGLHKQVDRQRDKQGQAEQTQASLSDLKQLTTALAQSKPTFRCKSCGYASNAMQWQCPTCAHWGTTKPLFGLRGE